MNDNHQQMRQVIALATQTILFDTDYRNLTAAIQQLHEVFSTITSIKAGDITDKDINLSSGKAVSSIKAAHCLMEIERTRKFLKGIYKAINVLLEAEPTLPINICYAGCGPYASLLTPLTSIFTPQQVRFILLDINTVSLDAARKIYTDLQLLDYVHAFVAEDATTYQFPESLQMRMVISETMLNGLRKEPQLAIMNNLVHQLDEKAIFIPEAITVDAVLTRWKEEHESFFTMGHQPKRIIAGNVYRADRQFQLPQPVVIQVPASETHNQLDLFTEIQVFDTEVLTAYNCSLTLPLHVMKLENHNTVIPITFEYEMSETPGFSCHF